MGKIYRTAIIGATGRGDYGHHVDGAVATIPNLEIVGVADADEVGRRQALERLNAPGSWADYRQMIQATQPDIVVICPRWTDQHHQMLMAAAEAGCHIYMEKPFCRTLKEADEVVQALEMRHLHLGIAHITQYSPVLDMVQSLIQAGEIGEILEIRGCGKEDRRGGAEDLWVLGSHVFAMMRTLGGGHPLSCTATVTSGGNPITQKDVVDGAEGLGLLAGDRLHARYDFTHNVKGYFASRRHAGGRPSRFGVQIFGSKGIIEMQSGYLQPAWILRDSSWSPGRTGSQWQKITSAGIDQPEPRTDGSYDGGHIAAVTDLIESIEQGRPTRCSAEDCRGIVEMTAAVFESQRVGRRVELPLATRENPLSLL